MSHFAVGVITKGRPSEEMLNELLEPYSENLQVAPYIERTKQQIIDEAVEKLKDFEAYRAGQKKEKPWFVGDDGEPTTCREELDLGRRASMGVEISDEDIISYLKGIGYEDYEIDAHGNTLTTYNPKSKWDWWVVGGRWSEEIPLKEAELISEDYGGNMTPVSNIDTTKSNKERDSAYYSRFWDINVEGMPLAEDEDKENFFTMYNKEYYRKTYGDKETYLRCMNTFYMYSMLTPDGEWHELGKMGWFGCSYEEDGARVKWIDSFEDNFITPYSKEEDDYWLTVVDCHI